MRYIAVFNAKQGMSEDVLKRERDAWVHEGLDEIVCQGCAEFERYETVGNVPRKIFLVMDTESPAILDRLNQHFNTAWAHEFYPVHITHPHLEDHTIICG